MENVKQFFHNPIHSIGLIVLFVLITQFFRGCSKSAEKIGNEATNEAVQQIKLNNEIEGLHRQIEAIENHVLQLDSQIARVDSLRIKNFVDARSKSLHDNYSELSSRYTKQKAVR